MKQKVGLCENVALRRKDIIQERFQSTEEIAKKRIRWNMVMIGTQYKISMNC